MPSMPNKQNAAYDEWSIWFEKYFAYLKDDVILIGWSLGGMFLAKYLSDKPFPVKIKSLFLLAALAALRLTLKVMTVAVFSLIQTFYVVWLKG